MPGNPTARDGAALVIKRLSRLHKLCRHVSSRARCIALDPPHRGLGIHKNCIVPSSLLSLGQAVELSHGGEEFGIVGLLLSTQVETDTPETGSRRIVSAKSCLVVVSPLQRPPGLTAPSPRCSTIDDEMLRYCLARLVVVVVEGSPCFPVRYFRSVVHTASGTPSCSSPILDAPPPSIFGLNRCEKVSNNVAILGSPKMRGQPRTTS